MQHVTTSTCFHFQQRIDSTSADSTFQFYKVAIFCRFEQCNRRLSPQNSPRRSSGSGLSRPGPFTTGEWNWETVMSTSTRYAACGNALPGSTRQSIKKRTACLPFPEIVCLVRYHQTIIHRLIRRSIKIVGAETTQKPSSGLKFNANGT